MASSSANIWALTYQNFCTDISLNYEVIKYDGEKTEIMNYFALRKAGKAESTSATLSI